MNLVRFWVGALGWMLLIASRSAAQTQSPDVAATELVRQTVAHELAAVNAGGHYMYRSHKETPQGSETRDKVETREWLISRLIRKNGQPLPPAQRQQEDERLRGLLTNRALLIRLQDKERYDEARVRRIIKALPEAFLYQSAGTENNSSGRKLARVTFRPNPTFTPQSRELRVLQGMEGAMLIDLGPSDLRGWKPNCFKMSISGGASLATFIAAAVSCWNNTVWEATGGRSQRWRCITLTGYCC